ncbi:DDE domain-containing protein [Vibrio splendidus]|jgi:hypothetical protein|uniref:DDE domain-containing protein n=1 Tax=Vibrio tasmaniensis TaxID=212663 RepID=A0A2N7NFG8_9VIBR|nr:DDE domain-containing protein [Vibrio tasmaniensis 1F-187]PMG26525.1 DDE domain-containing protein [Vibrio splendidus]PMJ38048.1 DDE domain-containing protein [Vibrio cyclitrophicus]PMP12409.1 DDE domain-containing protein [Vibrio tasmaniensis]PMO01459.1 DDE domain-containing protein [Vibrio splendidus]
MVYQAGYCQAINLRGTRVKNLAPLVAAIHPQTNSPFPGVVGEANGHVIDFLLCDRHDEKAARAFFTKAIGYNGLSEKVVIDKSGTNALALHNINVQLWLTEKRLNLIEVFQVKYLNNIVEQSHRKVKGKIHQCLGGEFV